MTRLAYNAPPDGYNLAGQKKWTHGMESRLGHTIRIFMKYRKPDCTPEELMEKVLDEMERIRKEFGYTDPKTHEQ